MRDLSGALGLRLYAGSLDAVGTLHGEPSGSLVGAASLGPSPSDSSEVDAIQRRVDERRAARAARDYATADWIRDELAERGIELEDTPGGTIWRRVR